MRIVLVLPTFHYKYEYPAFTPHCDFSTGPAYLASALKRAGHEVFGVNPNNDASYRSAREMLYDKLRRALRDYQPGLIGLGGLCTEYAFIRDAIRISRELSPGVPIVCGGGIINNDAQFVFSLLKPDFCVIGEGEETMVRLADCLASGGRGYEQVPNLGYWRDGSARFTPRDFQYGDINARAFPDYEPFGIAQMLDEYSLCSRYWFRYPRSHPRPMPIITARGCPFSCSFCVHDANRSYRPRSVENIMQEISFLHERYRHNILLVLDELFAVNKQRMEQFCLGVLEGRRTQGWDFNWFFQTHASATLDRDILKLAKEAGCYFFSYGLESASPPVLESMNKRITPGQVAEAMRLADEAKIGFGTNFIFGDPAETPDTIGTSMAFFREHCAGRHIYFAAISPYPGSRLFEGCLKRGIIRDKKEYYETIDERVLNMTGMADNAWFSWIYPLLFLTNSLGWAESTDAFYWKKEPDTGNHPAEQSGRSIYEVKANCPYCGAELYRRELIFNGRRRGQAGRGRGIAGMAGSIWRKLFRDKLSRMKLRQVLRNGGLCIARVRLPMLRSLKPLIPRKGGKVFFITGCSCCNRRVKIFLPGFKAENTLGAFMEELAYKTLRILLK